MTTYIQEIDILLNNESNNNSSEPFLIDVEKVFKIVDLINSTFEYDDRHGNKGLEWDYITFKAILRRLQSNINNPLLKGKITFNDSGSLRMSIESDIKEYFNQFLKFNPIDEAD